MSFSLADYDVNVPEVCRNPSPALLCEHAVQCDGGRLTDSGALVAYSGVKTGRSPKDKHVVKAAASSNDIWWGPVNFAVDHRSFQINRERAKDFLNTRQRVYCI